MFRKINSAAIILVLFLTVSIFAQDGFEAAASSNLTGISLPANALRMSPAAVPAEITQTLDKFVAAGEGKFQKGNSEVLAWTGGKQANINSLIDTMKAAGWQYEVGGVENGVTIFSLLKDGAKRRALMGFYGESDGILVLAWVEVLPNGSTEIPASDGDRESDIKVTNGAFNSIVGTWDNGRVSTVNRQNTITGATSPGSSTRFEYTFRANGTYSFTGLAQTQNYSCLDTLYNEVAGKFTLNGNQLTLTQTKNFWRKTSTCGANSERDYTLTKQTYQFSTKTNEYGQELICLTNENGEACYRRKQ